MALFQWRSMNSLLFKNIPRTVIKFYSLIVAFKPIMLDDLSGKDPRQSVTDDACCVEIFVKGVVFRKSSLEIKSLIKLATP